MPETEVLDAEVIGEELEPVAAGTLFRTDDPTEVLSRATEVAEALTGVLEKQKLYSEISGKRHVRVEGWLTLGAMLGVTPVCVWTKKLEQGWEARVEARTLDGRVIGAAEAECLNTEQRWDKADDYAIRSMAQTRATSKALGSVLRFVVTLAGFEGTPAEEMDGVRSGGSSAPSEVNVSEKQLNFIARLLKDANVEQPYVDLIVAWGEENLTGGREGTASQTIEGLKDAAKRDRFIAKLLEKTELPVTPEVPVDTEGLTLPADSPPPADEPDKDAEDIPF